jgi:N-acyl-D-amino-acid deacylase
MRDEGTAILDSVSETLEIGQRAGVPVVISHHKCNGRASWGMSRKTLSAIAHARAKQSVNLDVYPYIAGSTVLLADWIAGSERVIVTWSEPHPEFMGRDFESIRSEWGCTVEEAVERLSPAGGIYFKMDEDDLRRILRFQDAMIGSDGLPHDTFPHPRLWGTFPRVLGHYCRDLGLFSLEEAVYRMTGVPARVFGLAGRGAVRAGAFADIVLFDPDRITDEADFSAPTRPAFGIYQVIVNGKQVWRGGEWTGAKPGRILRRERAEG